jgi:ABC-2 type transport system permease protein
MRAIQAILIRNLTGLYRDKIRLVFTLGMTFFFLFIFSFTMKGAAGAIAQPMNYLLTGIIIMTVFQTALNNSMGILDDIASGFMKEILVAPIARWQISIGQVLSSMCIAVLQGLIILVVGLFIGLKLDVLHTLGMVGTMVLVGFTFSSMGLFIASLAKNSGTFQILVSVIVMPLTLLSGALIPTTVMPVFLRPLFFFNPLTYTASVFRFIALHMEHLTVADLLKQGVAFQLGGLVITPQIALLIIVAMSTLFFGLCVRQFNRADFSRVKASRHGHGGGGGNRN